MITIFRSLSNPKEPEYFSLDAVVAGIRTPKQAIINLVADIRSLADKKERDALKVKLPCICFSGKFSERKDTALVEHSGLAVIDLDHLQDVQEVMDKLKLIPYISVAFISPSGDGIKAVARIPKSKEHHVYNYEKLIEDLSGKLNIPNDKYDSTSKNPSRVCFFSHDPECYYNPNASCYTPPPKQIRVETDYNKINIAVNMVRLAVDGEKHHVLLKAARLMGGWVAGGYVTEDMAVQVLESEIRHKNITDFEQAQRTIKDGIEHGKKDPLYETEALESAALLEQNKVKLRSATRKYEFLTDPEEDDSSLKRYMTGDFKLGATTGYEEFDKHFLFKEGEFNVVLGHPNTGKSFFMWWLMVLSAVGHSWRWIVYSTENKISQIKKKLIEFYLNKPMQTISDAEYTAATQWIDDMFAFIRIDKEYTAYDILDFAKILMDEKEYKGFLIDPYNSLSVDKMRIKEMGNMHVYDYAVASEFVRFTDKNNISIYLNAHAMSEAQRRRHPQGHRFAGHPTPPEAADIEGGGKFTNRVTGFYLVIHRYIYHESEWKYTRVDIKKVKDVETGGKPTRYEEPIEFEMNREMTRFTLRNDDYNPIYPTAELPESIDTDLHF